MPTLFHPGHRPPCSATKREWRRQGFRARHQAAPPARVHTLLDRPHGRGHAAAEPLDPEAVTTLRDCLLEADPGTTPPELEDEFGPASARFWKGLNRAFFFHGSAGLRAWRGLGYPHPVQPGYFSTSWPLSWSTRRPCSLGSVWANPAA